MTGCTLVGSKAGIDEFVKRLGKSRVSEGISLQAFGDLVRRVGDRDVGTALARRLVVVAWHLLQKNEPYRYAPPERTRHKLRH